MIGLIQRVTAARVVVAMGMKTLFIVISMDLSGELFFTSSLKREVIWIPNARNPLFIRRSIRTLLCKQPEKESCC